MKNQRFYLRHWSLLLMLLCCSLLAHAQQVKMNVHGVVTDNNGEPLIGVSVKELNTDNGTITDAEGGFSLRASRESMIEFSYVGYKTYTERATERHLRIILTEDLQALDEVVVVGYGTQKKVNLTG